MTISPPAPLNLAAPLPGGTELVELYLKHIGSGRAVMGRVMGGMAEVRSEGPWIQIGRAHF
jgi:putrescine aminotransferase